METPQDLKLFAATRTELIDSRTGDAYPVVSLLWVTFSKSYISRAASVGF